MTLARRLAPFIVVPLVLGLEGFAWYGVRSMLWSFLMEVGAWEAMDAGSTMSAMFALSAAGAILGGLLAVAIGPWALLPLSLAALGAGLLALPLFPPELYWLPLALASLGYGAARPAAYALVAVELAAPRENLRSAALLLVYGAVNVGAALAGVGASYALDLLGHTVIFSIAGGIATAGALVAVVPGVLAAVDRAEPDPEDRARALHMPTLGAAAALLLVASLPVALLFHGMEATYRAIYELEGAELLVSLNPVIVALVAPVLAGLLLAAYFLWGRAVPALPPAGIGFVLLAVGVGIGALAAGSSTLVVLAMVVSSMGEVLAIPLLVSRLVGDLHWRLVALVAGVWTGVVGALGWLLGWAAGALPALVVLDSALLWAGVVLGVTLGAVLIAAAIPLQGRVYASSPEPERA